LWAKDASALVVSTGAPARFLTVTFIPKVVVERQPNDVSLDAMGGFLG